MHNLMSHHFRINNQFPHFFMKRNGTQRNGMRFQGTVRCALNRIIMAAFNPPKFRYPPEWGDRERMNYLLAPIPPNKSLSSHDSKITFWASFIKSSSQELKKPVFTERELQARFKWNQFTSPGCLSSVISSMESAGEVIKMTEIRQSVQQNVGWVSWGVGMIKKPMSWALKNYLSSPAGANMDEEYVVVSAIKVYVTVLYTG